jgi:hypothetical protein
MKTSIEWVTIRLREFGPYAAIALVVPGGSVLAVLLWIFRKNQHAHKTQEI